MAEASDPTENPINPREYSDLSPQLGSKKLSMSPSLSLTNYTDEVLTHNFPWKQRRDYEQKILAASEERQLQTIERISQEFKKSAGDPHIKPYFILRNLVFGTNQPTVRKKGLEIMLDNAFVVDHNYYGTIYSRIKDVERAIWNRYSGVLVTDEALLAKAIDTVAYYVTENPRIRRGDERHMDFYRTAGEDFLALMAMVHPNEKIKKLALEKLAQRARNIKIQAERSNNPEYFSLFVYGVDRLLTVEDEYHLVLPDGMENNRLDDPELLKECIGVWGWVLQQYTNSRETKGHQGRAIRRIAGYLHHESPVVRGEALKQLRLGVEIRGENLRDNRYISSDQMLSEILGIALSTADPSVLVRSFYVDGDTSVQNASLLDSESLEHFDLSSVNLKLLKDTIQVMGKFLAKNTEPNESNSRVLAKRFLKMVIEQTDDFNLKIMARNAQFKGVLIGGARRLSEKIGI